MKNLETIIDASYFIALQEFEKAFGELRVEVAAFGWDKAMKDRYMVAPKFVSDFFALVEMYDNL